jgi:hypothetical protein
VIITFSLLHVRRPLWREDGSAVCNAIAYWVKLRRTRNHTLLSRLRLTQPQGSRSPYLYPTGREWSSRKSKSRSLNQNILMSSPRGCIRAKFNQMLGGLHEKLAVQRGILGPKSASALGPRKATKNLVRVGRSQDLPDANSLPALNTRALTLVPIRAVSFSIYKLFSEAFVPVYNSDKQQTVYNTCGRNECICPFLL